MAVLLPTLSELPLLLLSYHHFTNTITATEQMKLGGEGKHGTHLRLRDRLRLLRRVRLRGSFVRMTE